MAATAFSAPKLRESRAIRRIARLEARRQPDGMTFADPALEDFASTMALPPARLWLWGASSSLAAARSSLADRFETD